MLQCNPYDHPIRAALYARVSSEQQAQAGTIDSQVAAIVARAAEEALTIEAELRFIDQGHSGATLVRPALERLRDQAAAGAIDRLYVLCPDRLARSYAYQMLLVDELQKCGVELVFLNHPLGKTPEDNLLLQVQGMVAEYERAKIIERGRRGKLHAARQGRVNVMGKAPYGYRYLPAAAAGGMAAQYNVHLPEAAVVQQIFQWVAQEQISLGQICKRLEKQGILSPSGKTRWNASTLFCLLKNPAYKGAAAFGKRRNCPMRPRLRVRRNGHEHPRNGQGSYRTPSDQWISIPVPGIVDEALFDAAAAQLAENRQRHRMGQRIIHYLLAELLVCKCCGYAYGGRYNGTAQKRKYSYYRCAGTEAHRFGGQKVCANKSLRQDLLDQAVWNDVRSLLSDPGRVEHELRRRIEGDEPDAQQQAEKKLAAQIEKVRRAIARLIDAYGEGLMDKSEFEPRIKSARVQLSQWQEQLQQQIDQQAQAREMKLMIDNLQTFSQQVHSGLENADWPTRRQIITTLDKRVEIEPNQVTIVYRVYLSPFDRSPNRGILHYCLTRQSLPSPHSAKQSHLPIRQSVN
jgi:site-specific DNA recombinase